MTAHDDHASYLTAVKALSARLAGADPHRPPENPTRPRQILGVNGGNGVSQAMPRPSGGQMDGHG